MATILVGYDTETAAVGEALSLFTESPNFPLYAKALDPETCREALELLTEVHADVGVPATLFVCGRTLLHALEPVRTAQATGLFDVQQHTFSHVPFKEIVYSPEPGLVGTIPASPAPALAEELAFTSRLIRDHLGGECVGLRTPFGYYRGLRDRPDLLEIVRGAATSPDALVTCLQVAKRLRKISVLSSNAFGFIGNRIYAAYRRQCEFMLEEGASPQQIDSALEAFGFAMGPFAVGDMSGLDIAWRMRQSLAATRDPIARYVYISDMLCESGRLGQKSGAGYYRYEHAGGSRQTDGAVDAIIDQARAAKGVVPRALSDEEITRRALLSMINEAALLLEEKVAEHASDVDVVMVNGYGFPKWEGGPVFWARERGVEALEQDLDWLAEMSGLGFSRCDVRYLYPSTNTN